MKNIFVYLTILSFFSAKSQTVTSSCNAPANIVKFYNRDAAKMAVAMAFKVNSTYKDSIVLDRTIYNRYLNALLAVYNATTFPVGDTIYQLAIHANLRYKSANDIVIGADSTLTWVQNVKNNIIPSGNSMVDYLMNKYYLKKTSYLGGGNIVLTTDTGCNSKVLVNSFNAIAGIFANQVGVTQTYIQLDGTDIKDSLYANFIDLNYIIQWGDCPSGCICRSTWSFRVHNDCTVEYLSRSGCQVYGLLAGISSTELPEENFKIFPNPINDILNIEYTENKTQLDKLSITNTLGQVVFILLKPKAREVIDLRNFPGGVYYLKVENLDGSRVFKILKE